jgi:hypothetical protein
MQGGLVQRPHALVRALAPSRDRGATAIMMDVTRGPRGEVVIRIEGTFDTEAARRLSDWMREVPPDAAVVLEFGGRDCLDLGLAAVAGDLAARERLVVRGLSRHQQRLLAYLGVELERPAARARAAG